MQHRGFMGRSTEKSAFTLPYSYYPPFTLPLNAQLFVE